MPGTLLARRFLLRGILWFCVAMIPAAPAAAGAVDIRWLGVAGFSLEADEAVVLHDPYLSRPGLMKTAFARYRPDPAVLEPLLRRDGPAPELGRAGLILVGHSHFDHLGDVPWIAKRTGARIAGSRTTALLSEAYGADPDRIVEVEFGASTSEGVFDVRAVESRHARVLLGSIPLDGELTEVPEAPCHVLSWPMGGAVSYRITHRPSGLRVFTLSSADVEPEALARLAAAEGPVDVVLAAIMGRDESFTDTLVKNLRPRWVVPHHFDNFFTGLDDPDPAAPSDASDLEAFEAEVRAAAEREGISVSIKRLGLFERWSVPGPDAGPPTP